MTTIRDVARVAGVSVATVSHVINESRYVSPATRVRVVAAIEELRYRRDGVARSLRRNKTGTLGIMISDITNPYFSDLFRGVEDAVYGFREKQNFILCNTEEDTEKERMYLDVLLEKKVDGLIVAPAGGNVDYFAELVASGLPLVFVDRSLPGIACDCVMIDNREASRRITSHLIELGHRRIVLVKALLKADTIEDRIAGFRDALATAGLPFDPENIIESRSDIEAATFAGLRLLDRGPLPDAIYATNNFMTLGIMRALAQRDIECPRDVALAGFDDFPWATAFRPRLTVIAQPAYTTGREATNLLFERMQKRAPAQPVRLVLKPSLLIRESCGEALIAARRAALHSDDTTETRYSDISNAHSA
jgi:LacI family transcriptional regulator